MAVVRIVLILWKILANAKMRIMIRTMRVGDVAIMASLHSMRVMRRVSSAKPGSAALKQVRHQPVILPFPPALGFGT